MTICDAGYECRKWSGGKGIKMISCSFCANGLVIEHSFPEDGCASCLQLGPPPNAFTNAMRQFIQASRVCQPHIPDGPDKPYRITVLDAAEQVKNKGALLSAISLRVQKGLLPKEHAAKIAVEAKL